LKRAKPSSRIEKIIVNALLLNSPSLAALLAIPANVLWSYLVFWVILLIGVALVFLSGDWQKSRGFDKLILFGAVFYAAPIAAFGTEHFTVTPEIASMVPKFVPWHFFWAYFVGACFIAAGLSLVTRIQTCLAASLLAITFFLFVALMDIPAYTTNLHDRFLAALMLRELSFGAGALALAVSLTAQSRERLGRILATIARYFIAIAVLFYCFEQFRHAGYVPAIPLEKITPAWLFGHAVWTYLTAALYVIPGILLLIGKKTRLAAAWIGLTVLFTVLVVYVPIAVAERASLEGINFMADTLMYSGAVLLLARAMPHESRQTAHAPASSAAPAT
jgi:uncharacterized membrane protein YphA (DoxX/SURF4 family)/uncharacterized membrane protein